VHSSSRQEFLNQNRGVKDTISERCRYQDQRQPPRSALELLFWTFLLGNIVIDGASLPRADVRPRRRTRRAAGKKAPKVSVLASQLS
jgi:hypothetical protein